MDHLTILVVGGQQQRPMDMLGAGARRAADLLAEAAATTISGVAARGR